MVIALPAAYRGPPGGSNCLQNPATLVCLLGIILRTAPGLTDGAFTIEQKKIIISDGVRHEIDLFVTVQIASGYESRFIFECKNQEAKVGKNAIVALAEKQRVTRAQRAFFVAKSFTKDAEAQARKDGIELLHAEVLDASSMGLEILEANTERLHCTIGFVPGVAGQVQVDRLLEAPFVRPSGRMRFGEFRDRWQADVVKSLEHDFWASPPADGTAHYQVDLRLNYAAGEASVDQLPIVEVRLAGFVAIRQRQVALKYAFDVKSRGRVAFFEDDSGHQYSTHLWWPNRPASHSRDAPSS